MNVTQPRNLSDIASELEQAMKELEARKATENAARSRTTEATNMVNRLQKEFDEAVKKFKESAPRESDWRRSLGAPVEHRKAQSA